MADMNNMNKEYRLERMNHYAGTMVTERTYNLTIGLTLLWGVLINVVMATFFTYQILSMNYLLVLVLYFAGTIGCSILVHKSNSPAVSFAGFTGMAISMGLLLTFYVTAFTGHSVSYAFIATALITVIMVLLSMLYPGFFQNLGRTLFVSLIGCILVELIGSLLFGRGYLSGRGQPVRQNPVHHRKETRLSHRSQNYISYHRENCITEKSCRIPAAFLILCMPFMLLIGSVPAMCKRLLCPPCLTGIRIQPSPSAAPPDAQAPSLSAAVSGFLPRIPACEAPP